MSLILDALKRAERERQAPPGVVLGDLRVPRPARRGARLPWRLLMIAVIAIGAVGAWKVLHRRAHPETVISQAAPKPASAPPVVASTPPPSTILASPPRTPPAIPGTEGMTSLEEVAQGEPEPQPAAPPKAAPQPAPAAAPAKKSATTSPGPKPQTTTAVESSAPAETPAPAAQETPAPPPAPEAAATPAPGLEVSPVLTQPAQYRRLKEMPPEYRAEFPQLTVEVHVYQPIPQQRFVIVNGRRYRQGETLAEGPQLVEIVPDGLVLDYRNERLLLPITR